MCGGGSVIPLCHSGKGENTIQESDRSRLTYNEGVTVAKFVLKGADQIPPFEFARCWRGAGGQLNKSVWLVTDGRSGFGSDGARVSHLLDGDPTSALSKVLQDRVEEM